MPQQTLEPLNVVRIVGVIAGDCVVRELAEGRSVTQWRMKVSVPGEPTVSVPCAAEAASIQKKIQSLPAGTPMLIEGSVASRYWVSSGQTGSRVEIQVTHAEKCKLNT